jgi:fructose-bisphosphate aldolase class I
MNAMNEDLRKVASALVTRGKGILAADETPGTLSRRFEALGIVSTEESCRNYREMLFSTPGISAFISGVILQDKTIHQASESGVPLIQLITRENILPGIKVDAGAKQLARSPSEKVTEGLDGLRERLAHYRSLGARFAKWRAVILITDELPTRMCIRANAHALARYAALCQEQGLVPIVEPEALMNGSHSIDRCEKVTASVLHTVFDELFEHGVTLEAMLLKPNMVISGEDCSKQASKEEVAKATLRCLLQNVPAAVAGIVFLSGGQSEQLASAHLNEIHRLPGSKSWPLSFSYGRALQDSALRAWRGRDLGRTAGQREFYQRASCNSAASTGLYTEDMERTLSEAGAHTA